MAKLSKVVVNGYSEQWLRRGFPWVYPKEVERGHTVPGPGTVVAVRSRSGQILGTGIADDGWIAVRVFRFDAGAIDEALVHGLLDEAQASRQVLVDEQTTAFRLVNGENDGLPGVRIDIWGHFAVLVLDSPALRGLVPLLVSWLEDRRATRGIALCFRPDPRDRSRDGLGRSWVGGRPNRQPVRVTERGTAFLVRPDQGPDVGLYCDMREVRRFLEPHWLGRRVLNTFAFTGAFSVVAALGGAAEVVTVDLADAAIERAQANFQANEIDAEAFEFLVGETHQVLDRFRRRQRLFDLVILDPPSFSRDKRGKVWSAKSDWPRLVAAAARVIDDGGWLVAASNQGSVAPKAFRQLVESGLKRAGRRGQLLWWGTQAPDFPAATWFPEGSYLKVGVWRVMSGA